MMMMSSTRASRCAIRALWTARSRAVPAASQFKVPSLAVRTHMNHGGDPSLQNVPTSAPGPRTAGIELGLPSATGVHNILRLLESSHGPHSSVMQSSEGYCWHPQGKIWRLDEETQQWILHPIDDGGGQDHQPSTTTTPETPSLLWLIFSDARTALAKVVGADGYLRYLSILQLDEHKPRNDGWRIVREVVSAGGQNHQTKSFTSVKRTVLDYQAVEHGGGWEDQESAETIFDPQASLLAVGCSEHHDHDHHHHSDNGHDTTATSSGSPWEAPAGHFLEIPLTTYLDGVLSQTIHSFEASQHDDIVSIDVMPCGNVAAAVVRVGNGGQTRVFEDHLLLGRSTEWKYWRILSKTFSPHPWPQQEDMTLGAMIEESRNSSAE